MSNRNGQGPRKRSPRPSKPMGGLRRGMKKIRYDTDEGNMQNPGNDGFPKRERPKYKIKY